MKTKMRIPDFKTWKAEGRKWTWTICYDYMMASIVEESETEMILVGDSCGMVIDGLSSTVPVTLDEMIYHTKIVVAGAPNTLVVGDMPFGTYQVSEEQAVENACKLFKESGCDCIKLEGGKNMASRVAAIVNAGVPVVGHIGLTPQSASALGGLKLQGKSKESADKLIEDAIALRDAGVCALCLECVPAVVAKKITEEVGIATMGCGAGIHCDCQELNLYDLTGMFNAFTPKFVKRYCNVREEMVNALNQFHKETLNFEFPTAENSYNTQIEGY